VGEGLHKTWAMRENLRA